MYPTRYLLAFSLLTAPIDRQSERPEGWQATDVVRPTLQYLAIASELLDPREIRYILARAEEFDADLALLQRRSRDLTDAPCLADGQRFPDRPTVNEMLAFNRCYRQYLNVRQSMELAHAWKYQAALQETDQLYEIWDIARDARCEYYYVSVRRQALRRLREMVGDEAYYTGRLPPHVPVWRFQKID